MLVFSCMFSHRFNSFYLNVKTCNRHNQTLPTVTKRNIERQSFPKAYTLRSTSLYSRVLKWDCKKAVGYSSISYHTYEGNRGWPSEYMTNIWQNLCIRFLEGEKIYGVFPCNAIFSTSWYWKDTASENSIILPMFCRDTLITKVQIYLKKKRSNL